jgi:hypothetical protein
VKGSGSSKARDIFDAQCLDILPEGVEIPTEGKALLISSLMRISNAVASRYDSGVVSAQEIKPWSVYKGGADRLPIVYVPFNSGDSNLEGLLYALMAKLKDEVAIQLLSQDFSPQCSLIDKEVDGGILGIWSAVTGVRAVTSDSSFGKASHPVDLGWTAALAECAISACRAPGSKIGRHLSLIPAIFVGAKGSSRYLANLRGKLISAASASGESYIIDTLFWLIEKWASTHQDLGLEVLHQQKLKWHTVKTTALPYKIEKKKEKKKTSEVVVFTSPVNPALSPYITGSERAVLKLLAKTFYHERIDEIEAAWKDMSAPEQHENFDATVKTLKDLHHKFDSICRRLNSRIAKRKRFFKSFSKKEEPSGKKVKSSDKGKFWAGLAKEMLASEDFIAKYPLVASIKFFVLNSDYENIWNSILAASEGVKDAESTASVNILRKMESNWKELPGKRGLKPETIELYTENIFKMLDGESVGDADDSDPDG